MENVNRLLLENVLPAHVAAHFIGDKLNEVGAGRGSVTLGEEGKEGTAAGPPAERFLATKWFPWVLASPLRPGQWRLWSQTRGGQDSSLPWALVFTCAHWGPQYLSGRIAARIKCRSGICHRTTS